MLKNLSLFAVGLIAAVSIGCGGTAPPTTATESSNVSPETAKALQAAAKEAKGDDLTPEDEASMASPAGNKGAGVPRQAIPDGTPKQ